MGQLMYLEGGGYSKIDLNSLNFRYREVHQGEVRM